VIDYKQTIQRLCYNYHISKDCYLYVWQDNGDGSRYVSRKHM